MKLLLFGATGMIGSGTLIECLDHPDVDEVIVVGRRSCGVEHEKVTDVVTPDVTDLGSIEEELPSVDACLFCLGVSAAGMTEEAYSKLTFDLTMDVANTLFAANPGMYFVYVSGQGTDSTEKGRAMWARVKGRFENQLLAIGFEEAVVMRPGYIQPVKGVTSSTTLYNVAYAITGPFYPILRRLAKNSVMTTEELGLAMIVVAREGAAKSVLEVRDIRVLFEDELSYLGRG